MKVDTKDLFDHFTKELKDRLNEQEHALSLKKEDGTCLVSQYDIDKRRGRIEELEKTLHFIRRLDPECV